DSDGGALSNVAFSADGKRLATSGNGAIHIWDLTTKQELCPLDEHASRPTALAFSADGNMLASSFMDDRLCVWNLKTGKPIHRHRDGWYHHLQFSPGQLSALKQTGKYPDIQTSWNCWELETGKEVQQLPLSSGMQWLDHYRSQSELLVAFN